MSLCNFQVDIRYSNMKESDFAVYIRVKGIHVIEVSLYQYLWGNTIH
jgi:hypothetical protein